MRLFAGVELDAATHAVCADAQVRLQRAAFDAKYELAEKLHITLAFLGRVDDARLPDVIRVLEDVAQRSTAFELSFDRVSAFPNERRPRIAYVGSRSQGAPYRTLVHALHEAYRGLGFDFKEDPVAHVTIARVKGGSLRPLPMVELPAHVMRVGEVVLFESLADTANDTSRYEVRHAATLQ